jgi:ribosomal protein L37AE/L43A
MEMLKDEKKNNKCPKCESDEIEQYFDEIFVCQKCGYRWDSSD